MELPNKLTLSRIFLAVFFTIFISLDMPYLDVAAFIVFVAASITDLYDGKLARKHNLVTTFGKLMDPLADKILTAAAFILLITQQPIFIPAWMALVIIAREFTVTGLRLIAISENKVIDADNLGKIKTITQLTTIITILFFLGLRDILQIHTTLWTANFDNYLHMLATGMMWLTLVITAYSGINYIIKNKSIIKV